MVRKEANSLQAGLKACVPSLGGANQPNSHSPSSQQQRQHVKAAASPANTARAASQLPHMKSEASIMSVESDDDVNDLTGKLCYLLQHLVMVQGIMQGHPVCIKTVSAHLLLQEDTLHASMFA